MQPHQEKKLKNGADGAVELYRAPAGGPNAATEALREGYAVADAVRLASVDGAARRRRAPPIAPAPAVAVARGGARGARHLRADGPGGLHPGRVHGGRARRHRVLRRRRLRRGLQLRLAALVRPGSPRPRSPGCRSCVRRPFPSHLARGCSVCPERCTYTAPREEVPGYTTCQSDAIEAIVRAPPLSLPLSLRIADRQSRALTRRGALADGHAVGWLGRRPLHPGAQLRRRHHRADRPAPRHLHGDALPRRRHVGGRRGRDFRRRGRGGAAAAALRLVQQLVDAPHGAQPLPPQPPTGPESGWNAWPRCTRRARRSSSAS